MTRSKARTYGRKLKGPNTTAFHRRSARQLTCAVILAAGAMIFLAYLFSPRLVGTADAHRGSSDAAEWRLVVTNMHGQCGKGLLNWCYKGTRDAWLSIRRSDNRHYYRLTGYWQEHHPCSLCGGGRFSCYEEFMVSGASSHSTIDLPNTKRCSHV
jgi:hypothetical protein